jgi:O-antigen ligase
MPPAELVDAKRARLRRPPGALRPRASDLGIPVLVITAVAVGAMAASRPFVALAIVLGAALVLLILEDISALPLFLVMTMFVESVAFGPGLRIGRVAGVLAIAVVLCYLLDRGDVDLRPNALLTVVGAFGVWMLVSVYWAGDSGVALDTVFKYLLALAYMITFAVLVRTRAQLGAVFATLSLGAFVFGTLSFVGYATSVNVYKISTDPSTLRATASGLQGDHNFFAVYQVMALPAALAAAAITRRGPWRTFCYGVAGVIVLSVAASLSRTGLVMLSFVVVATLFLPARYFFRRAEDKLAYFSVLVVAGGLVALAGAQPFVKRGLTIFREHGISGSRGSGRVDLWRAAWHGFREHPFGGLGAGNFRSSSLDLLQSTPGVNDIAGNTGLSNRYVHNMYLETLAELGVIGFVLFMLILLLTAWFLFRVARRARAARDGPLEKMSLALLVTFVALGFAGFFLSIELNKPIWIIVGVALALDVMTRKRQNRPTSVRNASERI